MPPSSTSSSRGDDIDSETFGPLAAIPEASLVRLASNIARRVLQTPSSSGGKLVRRISGSYNIVHVLDLGGVKLVVRVPATGWGSGMTATAAQALKSQVATLRLIRRSTSIPVPEVYGWDPTSDNEIGAPYVCMSFLPGKRVSDIWFDDSGPLPRDELRRAILANLARTMAQFSELRFDKLGSVTEDEAGAITIGPVFDYQVNGDGSLRVEASGPYTSASEYLRSRLMLREGNVWARAETKVMHALMRSWPDLDPEDGFVLCPPDFDSQNILVDEAGTITGIIDWDLAHTVPRRLGYCRYPGWITRDWDPLMYGWPKMADSEDSPEALAQYRAYYNDEMGKALDWQGDWKFTEKSHITEAVWIAALNRINRLEICRKFVQVSVGPGVDALDVLYDIGESRCSEEDWAALEASFRTLLN